jgi:hypothetical protein
MKINSFMERIGRTIAKIKHDSSGITLLELTVSVFLFTLVIVLASGIFQTVVNSQRIAVIAEDLQENVRYDFEKMGKEIRTAQRDTMHNCITSGNTYYSASPSQLEFINYHGQCVIYSLSNGQIIETFPKSSDPNLHNGMALTPKEITITNLVFRVADSSADVPAFVIMRMHLSVSVKGAPAQQIDMETGLSSRTYQ